MIFQTLYANQRDAKKALAIAIDILNESDLPQDDKEFVSIDALCEKIKNLNKGLDYINRNHIVELFFKDRNRRILIGGYDLIKYKQIKYVKPPDTLYFAALKWLSDKMTRNGIRSEARHYVKLYETVELATEKGQRLIKSDNDQLVLIKINAGKAFEEGLKFSTYETGEYIVIKINPRYILGEV
jgi:RNA:NAD 2'-phosphotransferase (TPT1/KptA family)